MITGNKIRGKSWLPLTAVTLYILLKCARFQKVPARDARIAHA